MTAPTTDTASTTDTATAARDEFWRDRREALRVLIVGGIPAGALLVGVGSRLAMLVLRVTSPDRVRGVTSDDGFTIGQVTVGGTYNLLALGAVVGIIGAFAYRMVAPWLIGPTWFRRFTTGVAAAAVAGSMLIHSDGIDFTLLKPTWLAIGLFIALPGLFGALIGVAVDSVSRDESWTVQGRRRWALPLVAVGCFPVTLFPLLFAFALLLLGGAFCGITLVDRVRKTQPYSLAVRVVWLFIALLGLTALVSDVRSLA